MGKLFNYLFGPKVPKCKSLESEFGAIEVKDGLCPHCYEPHNDDDGRLYDVDGIKYPKCFNQRKGYTLGGDFNDWDEMHCCEECGTKFWFENGLY